jgi:hypothetical protein
MSEEPTVAEATSPAAVLDPAEVAPVFAAMHASSPEVRLALVGALIRLPLHPLDWAELCDYATWAIDSTESAAERSAVIEAAPYLPVRAFRERVARVAEGPQDPDHERAAEALARLESARPAGAPRGDPTVEGTKLTPAWAGGSPAGFTPHSQSELRAARSSLSEVLQQRGGFTHGGLDDRPLDPFWVTALFEQAGSPDGPGLGETNAAVDWIGRQQRGFRPDAVGLFREYVREEREDVLRYIRWQIGWTVSRGGLRGLIAEMTQALESSDQRDVIAAGHLIADAADYVLQGRPAFFGGENDGPAGPAVVVEEVEAWGGRGSLMAGPPEEAGAEPPEETGAEPGGVGVEGAPADQGRRTRGIEFPDAEANGHGDAAPGAVPPEREERWILAQPYDTSDPVHPAKVERAFRAGAPHVVQVQIGPERADMIRGTGGAPIDDVLPADGTSHDLVLVFVPPPGNDAQSAPVTLPPTGPTEMVTFQFRAGAAGAALEAQIVVLHQNRVLQTAVLRGAVVDDPGAAPADASIEFAYTVIRPGMADLDSRSRFDSAVVVSHTADGKPVAAAVSGQKVSLFDDDGIGRAADKISSILTDLADNPDKYAPPLDSQGNLDLIRELAFQGVELFNAMGRFVVDELAGEDLAMIQVLVSDPNDLVPVEFVYDLPAPTLTAGLCPNWRAALEAGRCDPANHPVDGTGLATVICPTGFWALSKVIERQVVDRGNQVVDLQGKDFAVRSEPNGQRMHLAPLTSALFGASQRVDRVKAGISDQVLTTLQGLTGDRASRADTWADWVQGVATLQPSLMVLLSHTEKTQGSVALEIGAGDLRVLAQITSTLVKAAPDVAPVVLLLGCDTAVADRELQSFVSQFRDSGAALVVGTIAAVLGEHAAPVAQALTIAIHEAASRSGDAGGPTFGTVMRDIRRKLLADGELMSLCLATYGDADWRLSAG